MKKIAVLLAIAALSVSAAFADLGVGAAAFYKSPVLIGQPIDLENVNVAQFSFGADVRLKIEWLQLEGLLLYSAGEVNSLVLYADAGLALDLAIVRLSLGAGPSFTGNFDNANTMQAGLNVKLGADLMLGAASLGLSYIMAMNIDNGVVITTSSGLLGLDLLFWL